MKQLIVISLFLLLVSACAGSVTYSVETNYETWSELKIPNLPDADLGAVISLFTAERGYTSLANPSADGEQLLFVSLGYQPDQHRVIALSTVNYDRRASELTIVVKETISFMADSFSQDRDGCILIRVSQQAGSVSVVSEAGEKFTRFALAHHPLLNPPPSGLRGTVLSVCDERVVIDVDSTTCSLVLSQDLQEDLKKDVFTLTEGDGVHFTAQYSKQYQGFVIIRLTPIKASTGT